VSVCWMGSMHHRGTSAMAASSRGRGDEVMHPVQYNICPSHRALTVRSWSWCAREWQRAVPVMGDIHSSTNNMHRRLLTSVLGWLPIGGEAAAVRAHQQVVCQNTPCMTVNWCCWRQSG
jgi:hypothetical protein